MAKENLKMFVWEGFNPDYSGGLAFAIARTEEEARKKILEARHGIDVSCWGSLRIHQLNKECAYYVNGGS